ncbi:MAG: hypothetical protein JJE22_04095 [Bacteroidia bacterium]|nr:hypothetical protein [Bacteroidia bacterium]
MTLSTDIKNLQKEKGEDVFQPANVSLRFPDSTTITEDIRVSARGHFRRDLCPIPPIMLNFRNSTSPLLNPLGKLKLVISCGTSGNDEQLVLKEYLIYKIYNLLEEKSFRARLVLVNYKDTKGKIKPISQYAFILEDDADMAKRNNCKKNDDISVLEKNADRSLTLKVALFEYFISNTDWSVPGNHNIKVIYSKKDDKALPYIVPYDFDHSGLVNADYAMPSEIIGTERVTERVYRGWPRTMEELEVAFELFNNQKDNIYSLINNFTYLKERTRKGMITYLDEFYKTINSKSQAKMAFIDKARTN